MFYATNTKNFIKVPSSKVKIPRHRIRTLRWGDCEGLDVSNCSIVRFEAGNVSAKLGNA
jgi:hypothetical protein